MTLAAGQVDAAATALEPVFAWLRGLRADGGTGVRWWWCAEWTDRVCLDEAAPEVPDDLPRLVWARWFGEAGDLELWREGDRFGWRFLGDKGAVPPPGVEHEDFFAGAEEDGAPRVLRRGEDRVGLLWEARDARVATADPETTLKYLADAPGRLQLRYTPFYDRGVVAAVRYRGIEPAQEDCGSTTRRK
jgi:hypothetical protein